MGSNRGRQFYRSDFIPSVMARQRGSHVDNHNYMQRLIASDPMYNHIRWMDEYMAYFRPNFFPPNPSFSRRGEFTAVPREMMNTNNRPFLIKYPPTIRDLQDMDQRRRHRMPRWIRSRTFWRQKRTDETQEVDHHNRQERLTEREAKEASECCNWKTIWRNRWSDLDYPADEEEDDEEAISLKEDEETTSTCSETLDSQQEENEEILNRNEDGGSGEPIIDDPFIQEQKDILELLRECDYQHEMLLIAGLGWFEGQAVGYESLESEEEIEVIVKMPDLTTYNSFSHDENLSPNSKKRKQMDLKQESAKWKLGSMWTRKRRKLENDDVKRRIAEMKGKRRLMREKLMVRKAKSDEKNRSRTNMGYRFLLEATKTTKRQTKLSKQTETGSILKSPNLLDSPNTIKIQSISPVPPEKVLLGKVSSGFEINDIDLCKENERFEETEIPRYVSDIKSRESDNCLRTIEMGSVEALEETVSEITGSSTDSSHDYTNESKFASPRMFDSLNQLIDKNVVKSLLGTMLSCENILFSRNWNLLSISPTATVKSDTEEHKFQCVSKDFTSEMIEWFDTKMPDKNKTSMCAESGHHKHNSASKWSLIASEQKVDKDENTVLSDENLKEHEKEIRNSEDLLIVYDNLFEEIFEHINVSSDFVNEMMSYIDEATVCQSSKLDNSDTLRKANKLGANKKFHKTLPPEDEQCRTTSSYYTRKIVNSLATVNDLTMIQQEQSYCKNTDLMLLQEESLMKVRIMSNSLRELEPFLEQNHFPNLRLDNNREAKISTSTPIYKQQERKESQEISLEVPSMRLSEED